MKGLIIAAPRTGSGKTTITLGLIAALRTRGLRVAPAKSGPDYIDSAITARVAGRATLNLDAWAMSGLRLRALAAEHAAGADLLLVEGAMGLFDGAADGIGSTGDLAAALGLPVILVIDAAGQGQSVAPLVHGFATWRPMVRVAGLILNRFAGPRHARLLRQALMPLGIPIVGEIPRDEALTLPSRHLGLVLPDEIAGFDASVAAAANAVQQHVNLDVLQMFTGDLAEAPAAPRLRPLGQRMAIARDDAFAFIYHHWLMDWRAQGAELSFFSPLADGPPDPDADAVFLPGGYPELHAARLAAAHKFRAGLVAARDRGALIYGECGGYMVLGQSLTDAAGITHQMADLLPISTRIDQPRRTLGYRWLEHASPLPFPSPLRGHEFHYSSAVDGPPVTPLFTGMDTWAEGFPPLGAVVGRVMGSYAHVIDVA